MCICVYAHMNESFYKVMHTVMVYLSILITLDFMFIYDLYISFHMCICITYMYMYQFLLLCALLLVFHKQNHESL